MITEDEFFCFKFPLNPLRFGKTVNCIVQELKFCKICCHFFGWEVNLRGFEIEAGILVCQILVVFENFYILLRIYELYEQSRESFDANIDEESNHFQEIPEEIYEDSDEIKGQLIPEWLLDVLNFPKNQCKNLMNFCVRI